MGEEAERLDDIGQTLEANEVMLDVRQNEMMRLYGLSEDTLCGNHFACPTCEKTTLKNTYNRRFCSTKCKDKYHNTTNDARRRRSAHRFSREHRPKVHLEDTEPLL